MITTDDRDLVRDMVLDILTDLSAGQLGDMEIELDDDYIEVDNIGLLGAAGFFADVSNVVAFLDSEMADLDYQLSTAAAYVLLASLIQYGIEFNFIPEKGWTDVADRFLNRAQDFAGFNDGVLVTEAFGPEPEWARILNYVIHNWNIKTEAYESTGFTNDNKVQMIRSTIIGCRAKGWLDYSKPWAKSFIAALQEDWVHFGGGFGQGMGTGSKPWSHG